MKHLKKILLILLVAFLLSGTAIAANTYTINGVEISYDSVEWPGEQGCWAYANGIYKLIWGVNFDSSFLGQNDTGNNLLQGLDDADRLFTAEHTEIFVKSAVPGAVIRITNAQSSESAFDSDGIQSDGTYGHNIIIAAIYNEGFVAFESLSSGTRERFYTWEEFYETWSADASAGASRYRYYKYVKWPNAPVLQLEHKSLAQQDWGVFLLFSLGGAAATLIYFLVMRLLVRPHTTPPNERSLQLILLLLPFFYGLFYVWTSAIIAVLFVGYLCYLIRRNGSFHIVWNELLILSLLLPFCYGLGSLWAVDRGLAPYGLIHLLPLPLFVLILQQFSSATRHSLLPVVPLSGGLMTVVCAILLLIPAGRNWLLIDGRLGGFFQYPNTFALFLLVGLIILSYEKPAWKQFVLGAVLLAGLLTTGSRTVLVLTLVVFLLRALTPGGKKQRLILLSGLLGIAALAVTGAILFPNSPLGRITAITTQSSTFLGRLLYFRDALPVIAHHPFGLGYLGYYYSQGSFQTGVYSAMFVHNELLQLLLDVGWIPSLAAVVILVRQLLRKGFGWRRRLVMLAILSHSMFDFSLQFTVIWLILLLACDGGLAIRETNRAPAFWLPGAIIIGALCLSFGTASFSERYAAPETTLAIYPHDTQALYQGLMEISSAEEMDNIADKILSLDTHISLAHSAKALVVFHNGDIAGMIAEKQRAIACAPYAQEEYQDYFDKLQNALTLCEQQGNDAAAAICRENLLKIPAMIQETLNRTSALGWKIHDQPELELTGEQQAFLSTLE